VSPGSLQAVTIVQPHLLQLQLVVLVDARHGCEAVPGAVPKHEVPEVRSHLDQRTALACSMQYTVWWRVNVAAGLQGNMLEVFYTLPAGLAASQ
jgi:hypothetical protein